MYIYYASGSSQLLWGCPSPDWSALTGTGVLLNAVTDHNSKILFTFSEGTLRAYCNGSFRGSRSTSLPLNPTRIKYGESWISGSGVTRNLHTTKGIKIYPRALDEQTCINLTRG
jgi:hypothetical protein